MDYKWISSLDLGPILQGMSEYVYIHIPKSEKTYK